MKGALCAWALSGLCACGRGHTDPGAGAAPTIDAALLAIATASPTPASAATGNSSPVAWRGTYKSVSNTLYVPPELKVSWKPSETTSGIGEGTISMTVDPSTGRVRGELAGPLGPASLVGLTLDGKLTASISRKDPTDHGFAGTMIGTLGPDKGDGTMNVSLAEGGALRSATFVLSSGTAAEASR
ncbi:MAG: hypothetical protein ACLP1X_33370 [Polyangiaceae bacterium]